MTRMTVMTAPLGLVFLGMADVSAVAEQQPLEEIVVTARRVSENLQDTPISMTAVTGRALENRGIFTTDRLDAIVPNLQFADNAPLAGNNTSSQVFIRGIGQTDPTAVVDPGVGIYIDDVYMGQSVGGTMDLRDIASVQVLRGPQGTLFGRNTIGGAILLTTTEPGSEFGGELRAGIGTDELRTLFAAVDLPLADGVRSRFSVASRDQNGYVTRSIDGLDLGDVNRTTFTAKLILDPIDNLQIRLLFDHTEVDENGSPLVFAASTETAAFQRAVSFNAGCPGMTSVADPVPLVDDPRCANDFWNDGPFVANGTLPLTSTLENYGGSAQVIWDVSDQWVVKSITAARNLDWTGARDADNTPFPILHTEFDSEGRQFSQEVQLLYQADRLTGVTGVYYFDERVDDIATITLAPPPAPEGTFDSNNTLVNNKSYALFTQWTLDVTSGLSLTAGARFTEDTKTSRPDQFNFATPSVKYLEVRDYTQKFDDLSLNLSASYRFSQVLMAYATYSEGFKSGGWNARFNQVQTDLEQLALIHPFGEEKAKNYEVGFKADLFDRTLRLNGALFSTDYNGLQLIYRFGVAPFLLNAGKATNKGFELEMNWVPVEGLSIDAAVGYLDATINTVVTFAGAATGVEAGNRLPFAPRWQGNVGAGYDIDLGDGWRLLARADAAFQSTTYFDALNTPEIAQLGTRVVVDTSLTLRPDDGPWRLVAGLQNLTDKLYPVAGNSSLGTGSGYAEIAYARQRQWFTTLEIDF